MSDRLRAGEVQPPLSAWRIQAIDRIAELKLELEELQLQQQTTTRAVTFADGEDPVTIAIAQLEEAKSVAESPPGSRQRFATVWRGSALDRVWLAIHRAHVVRVQFTPDRVQNLPVFVDARERAKQRLKPDDARLVALESAAKPYPNDASETLRDGSMGRAAVALRASYAVNAEQHRQLRNFRNILVITSLFTLITAAIAAVVGWAAPGAINLCWGSGEDEVCPSGNTWPHGGDVALVEFYGLLGAAVTGAIAVRKLRGTGTPYAVPIWSILVKLPIGALTAVLALLLLQVVDSFTIRSQQEIAAWAVIFGVAQEAFTRLIDRQAQVVLDRIPTSNKNDAGAASDASTLPPKDT